jgi:hypothetical protein
LHPLGPVSQAHQNILKQIPSLPGYALVTMNTTTMTVNMTTMTTSKHVLLQPVNELIAGQARARISVVRPVVVRRVNRVATAKPAAQRTWVSPVSETITEKLLYGALALSALTGIAYAMLSLVEHAQNWPVFNAWVGRILGA